jgi:8-hydroxy-5-deazaflavin:NADPH oxidoreductase
MPGGERVGPYDLPDVSGLVVGVLGGTGDQGRGLAYRLALTGLRVVVGSRDAARAEAAAADLGTGVRGTSNAECARSSDLVVVAVPWEGHAALVEGLADELVDKVVVDCVNPLGFDERGSYVPPVADGSACEQAARLLPRSTVVGAFHHVSAVLLLDRELDRIDTDIMVVGDDRSATDQVQALAGRIPGIRGVYAGRLRNARQVEALTANLVSVNRRYRTHAGLRVTGLDASVAP